MIVHIEIAISAAALLGGAGAASLAGPVELGWRQHPLRLQVALLAAPEAGPLRRRLGAGALALVLAGGTLGAYAAQPSAPERLPAQVIGVVGSGDQLSLKLKAEGAAPERTLKVGDTYAEDWKLKRLTNAEATLEKGAETRVVGLNPSGAATESGPDGEAAKVVLLAAPPPPRPPALRVSTPEEIRARSVATYGEATATAMEALRPALNGSDELARMKASAEYNTLLLNNPVTPPSAIAAEVIRRSIASMQARVTWMEGGRQGPDPVLSARPPVMMAQ